MSILDEARKKLAELGRGGATEQSILDRALELSGSSSDNPLNLMPNLKPGSVIQGLNGDKIRVDESLGDYLWRKPRDTFNSLKAGTLQVLANTALGVPAHWLGNAGAHEDDEPLGDNGIYAWGLRRQGLSEPEVQNALAAKRAEAGYTDNTPGVRASKWLLDKYNAAQDWIQEDYKRNVPNPDAWDEAVHGVGTTVGSYLAGLGAYAAGMPFGPVAAGLMGAAASGGLEAANEGADVLANAYKQGKYNEGLDAANKSFITNMGLNTALDFTAGRFNPLLSKINNPFLRWLAETGAETVNEAVMQEPMQGVIEGAATNTVNDGSGFWGNLWDETAKYPEYLKEVGPTTAASTLLSQMMFGGANYAANKLQQRQQNNELQELIPQVAEELYKEQQAQREAQEEAAYLKYLEDAVKRQDEYNADLEALGDIDLENYERESLEELERQRAYEAQLQRDQQARKAQAQEEAERYYKAVEEAARREQDEAAARQVMDDMQLELYEEEAQRDKANNENIARNQLINARQAEINAQNREYDANKRDVQARQDAQNREADRLEREREDSVRRQNSLDGVIGGLLSTFGEPNQLQSTVQSLNLGQQRLNSGGNVFNELGDTVNNLETARGTDGDINRIIANIDRQLEQLRSQTRSDAMNENLRRSRAHNELQQELEARVNARQARENQADRNNQAFNAQNEVNAQEREYNADKQQEQARRDMQAREINRLERERAALLAVQAVQRERQADRNNQIFNAQGEINEQNREYNVNKREQQARQDAQAREAARQERERAALAELQAIERERNSDAAKNSKIFNAQNEVNEQERGYNASKRKEQARRDAQERETDRLENERKNLAEIMAENAINNARRQAESDYDDINSMSNAVSDRLGEKERKREKMLKSRQERKAAAENQLTIDQQKQDVKAQAMEIAMREQNGESEAKQPESKSVTEQAMEIAKNQQETKAEDEPEGLKVFHGENASSGGLSYDYKGRRINVALTSKISSTDGRPYIEVRGEADLKSAGLMTETVARYYPDDGSLEFLEEGEQYGAPRYFNEFKGDILQEAIPKEDRAEFTRLFKAAVKYLTVGGYKDNGDGIVYIYDTKSGAAVRSGIYLNGELVGYYYHTQKKITLMNAAKDWPEAKKKTFKDTFKKNCAQEIAAKAQALETAKREQDRGSEKPDGTPIDEAEEAQIIKDKNGKKLIIRFDIRNDALRMSQPHLFYAIKSPDGKTIKFREVNGDKIIHVPYRATYNKETGELSINKEPDLSVIGWMPHDPSLGFPRYWDKLKQSLQKAINEIPELKAAAEPAQALRTQSGEAAAETETEPESVTEQAIEIAKSSNAKNTAKVRTASGTEITVKYKIMDVNDLITSNKANGTVNPDYPQELQPRDRTREASREQVNRIARNLDPELLGANRMASDGAPIIGNDRVVESGNGRVMAIRQAFNSGNADNYVKWLREHAEDFGLNNADFDGIKQPVLVRERQGNIDRVKFVQQANISTVSSMSPAERAKQDAGRITAAMLAKFNPNKEIRYNSEFIQDFGALIVEGSERGAFMDRDGKLSAQGLERVQNALLALAYQDDNLLIRMRESIDNDIKNVTNAMLQAAPKIAVLERGVKTGEIKPEFSIHKDITQAASALAQIRQDGMSIQDYLAQGSLFSDTNISDNAKILLKFFDDNKRSTKRITYLLTRYADLALDEGASGQQSMFGDERGKSNLLNDAIKYAKDAGNYGQLSLFGGEGEIYEQRTPREIDKGQINETYGEDEALDNVLNSDEQYTRNVALGLDEAAEQVGKLEDAINSKAKNKPNADLSIRDDVLNAVRAYDRLTKAGASVNAALSKLLKNERVPELKGLKLSDGAISVLEIFDKVKGSGAKIAAALINYSENALKADGKSKQELLTDALNYLDAKDGYQLDLDARRLEKRIAKILKDLNHKEIDAQTAKIYSKVIAENYKYFARATGLSIDDLINMRAFNFTADGVAKRGRGRPKKNGNNVEYNQIGKTRKAEMDAQLRKHRPDLSDEQRADIIAEIEKLGEQVKAGGNPKVEKAAIHWVLSGHIILPEDNYKIWDAVRVCEQKHLNPLNYSDPNEILVEYKYRFQPDNMRTDPDKVDEFSDKQVLPNGIVTYAVEDSKAGQAAVREVIDTNWGKEANPWCLTARQNDSLTDAWDYWKNYSAIPKRIAFKDGKLSAFCANSSTQTAWWDREDRPFFEGIPYTVKNNGDIFTYAYNEETGKNVKIYGVLKDGTRCEFYENGQLRISYLPDGTRRLWDKSGHLEYEILPDGTKRIFHKNGQMAREYLPDGTERGWHDNGQMSSEYLPDGTKRNWYKNGQISLEELPDGTYHVWYENGQLRYETLPDGTSREWYKNGQMAREYLPDGTERKWYDNGQMSSEFLPNGTGRKWYDNGQMSSEYLPDGTERHWYKNGRLNYETRPDGTVIYGKKNKKNDVYNQARIAQGEGLYDGLNLPFNPAELRTKSGADIMQADKNDALVTPDGSTTLGVISDAMQDKSGREFPAGVIQANAGAVQYIERRYGDEIREAGYKDAQTFLIDILNNYEKIYRGHDDGIILAAHGDAAHIVKSVVSLEKDSNGVYAVNDAGVVHSRYFNNKELLYTRSAPYATSPRTGTAGPAGNSQSRGISSLNATPPNSSNQIIAQNAGDTRRGYVEFVNKLGEDAQAIVHILQGADKSTVLHETAHVFLQNLRDFSINPDIQLSEAAVNDWNALRDWLNISDIDFSKPLSKADETKWRDAQEKFAAGAEKYFMDGKAPTSRLKRIFEIIKGWFKAIYEKARDITYRNTKGEQVPFNISKAAREVYDHIYSGGENITPSWQSERAANLEIGKADPNEYLTEDKLKDNNFVETTDEIDAKEAADLKAEREAQAAEDARPKNEFGVLTDSEEHINNIDELEFNNILQEIDELEAQEAKAAAAKKRGRPKTGGALEGVKARLRALDRGEIITNLHPVNEPDTASVESEAMSEAIKSNNNNNNSMLFSSAETEARFRNSRGDIQVRESTRSFWKNVGLKSLSKSSKSGQNLLNAKETFKRLTQRISASTATATNDMKKIIKNLTPAETELFMRKRIVDDLMWRKQEMPEAKLPWGLDGETLKTDYERITRLAEANENVMAAIKADEEALKALNHDMIELADKLGMSDLSQVLRNPHYFHHEILFNNDLAMTARADNSILGTANSKAEFTGIKTLDDLINIVLNRSYMKKYKGSERDMNSNYLAVTADVRGQQLQDLAILKALNEIKDKYDISGKLREAFNKAKANSSVESYAQEDYLKKLEEQIARENELRKSKGLKLESEEYIDDGSGRGVDILTPKANNTQSAQTTEAVDIDYVKKLEDSIKNGDTVMGRLDRQLKLKRPVEIGANNGLIDVIDDGDIKIPEGYVAFDPDAHGLFGYDGRRSKIQVALSQGLETAMTRTGLGEFTIEQIAEAMGHKEAKLWVIPKEVADTLKAFGAAKQPASFKKFLRKITKGWKIWQLFSPVQTIKYNLRNATGDLDAVLAGNPRSLKYIGQATGELINSMFRGKAAEGELEEYLIRGGDLGSETAQYFTTSYTQAFFDLAKDPNFKVVTKELNNIKSAADFKRLSKRAFKTLNKYSIGGLMKLSSFRENILRYATYLSYLEQMQANTDGMPDNWGASLREEIEEITDIRDRAYKLSNELLGDYDSISELGMRLRDVAVPFYSWLEVNAKRYYRLLKNGIWDGNNKLDFSKGLLKGLALKSPLIAYHTGMTLLRLNMLSIAIKAFNELANWISGGADDDLPPEVKDRPHITFGYTSDGRVSYFDRVGAMLDILDWVGQDSKGMIPFYRDLRDILNGDMSVTDFVKQTSSAAFNKAFNSLTPLLKMPIEIATGRTFYPDATHPRLIRDMTSYIAQSFGLSREVNAILGEPGKPYFSTDRTLDLLRYTADPKEGAYFYILDRVRTFQERELGKTFDGGAITRRGQALRKLKTAIRYKDKPNQRRYLRQYYQLGGTKKGLNQSVQLMHPLTGLSKQERAIFLRSLSPEDRKYLRRANVYFLELARSLGVKAKL